MSCTLKFREFILSGELNPTPPIYSQLHFFEKMSRREISMEKIYKELLSTTHFLKSGKIDAIWSIEKILNYCEDSGEDLQLAVSYFYDIIRELDIPFNQSLITEIRNGENGKKILDAWEKVVAMTLSLSEKRFIRPTYSLYLSCTS